MAKVEERRLPTIKYKFMTIKQVNGELFEGKPVYRILNNKSGVQLGILSFYKPWKQYIFSSQPECVFNDSCLRDILDFMKCITQEKGASDINYKHWIRLAKAALAGSGPIEEERK